MLIETSEDYDFTAGVFYEWAKDAGFNRTQVMKLAGPASAVIAIK
jgi:hypothetical protein